MHNVCHHCTISGHRQSIFLWQKLGVEVLAQRIIWSSTEQPMKVERTWTVLTWSWVNCIEREQKPWHYTSRCFLTRRVIGTTTLGSRHQRTCLHTFVRHLTSMLKLTNLLRITMLNTSHLTSLDTMLRIPSKSLPNCNWSLREIQCSKGSWEKSK